jgi:hypothetical protein
MDSAALPDGFGWVWADDTVRINLPLFVRTQTHTFEPVLSRKDAERVADAIAAHDRARRATGRARPLVRILVAHDTRYSEQGRARFCEKLSIALIERGHSVRIDEMVTMSALEAENLEDELGD